MTGTAIGSLKPGR